MNRSIESKRGLIHRYPLSYVPINTSAEKESELHISEGKLRSTIVMSRINLLTIIALMYLTGTCALVCNHGQDGCGSDCYYPMVHQCVEGHICRIGQKVCGSQCYYAIGIHECLEGRLCKLGQKICNGQCYYPIGQKCIKREFLIWMRDFNGVCVLSIFWM